VLLQPSWRISEHFVLTISETETTNSADRNIIDEEKTQRKKMMEKNTQKGWEEGKREIGEN
jgi:hypothetical protein